MALSTQPYKGARDFYPDDKRLQKYLFKIWREVCERYGYEEYDAPILEPLDIYLAKTGEEIVKEQTYTFEDRGGRAVAIRPEMTPTVSRMVAGKRQAGIEAEFEIISLVADMFKAFGAAPDMYDIRLSSRQLIDYVLGDYLGFNKQESHDITKLIDRMHKLEHNDFIAQLDKIVGAKAKESGSVEKLLSLLNAKELLDLPESLQEHPSAQALSIMLEQLQTAGIGNASFDITLMRGFDYYTDIVFEVFDTHPDNNRSMLGGGRYDGLVGLFGVDTVLTVGFGWGDVTLANFLQLHHLLPDTKSETDVYIVLVGVAAADIQSVVTELRAKGLNVAVDLSGRKVGDQLKNADKKGVEYVLIIGDTELKAGKFNLKNLASGKEITADIAKVIEVLSA
jgi:histidyl-tRNA synthetase